MEIQSFFTRKINEKIDLGYIKTGDLFKKIDDDCERMKMPNFGSYSRS